MEKLKAGEGYWTCLKEVLGWTIDTEAGTVDLPGQKLQGLNQLLAVPATQ